MTDDFQPDGPIVHGEPQGTAERYYEEKIAELVLTQSRLGKVIAERDALKDALEYIASGKGDGYTAVEVLTKLAAGELRKFTA